MGDSIGNACAQATSGNYALLIFIKFILVWKNYHIYYVYAIEPSRCKKLQARNSVHSNYCPQGV